MVRGASPLWRDHGELSRADRLQVGLRYTLSIAAHPLPLPQGTAQPPAGFVRLSVHPAGRKGCEPCPKKHVCVCVWGGCCSRTGNVAEAAGIVIVIYLCQRGCKCHIYKGKAGRLEFSHL